MLTTATKPHHPTVSLRPAVEAYDYEYFRSRLAEPALLAGAVAVRVFRAPLLAVPVEGSRRGGYMSFDLLTLVMATLVLLAEQPGFPHLRVRWSAFRDTCHTVEWGDRAPQWSEDDEVFGRFYGYSGAAIAAFTRRHHQTPSSAVPTPCSPTAPQLAEEGPTSHPRGRALCVRTTRRAPRPRLPTGRPRDPARSGLSRAGACCATASCSSRTPVSCCRTARSSPRTDPSTWRGQPREAD